MKNIDWSFIGKILEMMPIGYWAVLLIVELVVILNLYLCSKRRSIGGLIFVPILSIVCIGYVGYIYFKFKPEFKSVLFALMAFVAVFALFTVIYYCFKVENYTYSFETNKGYYGQYKTEDEKFTFALLNSRKKEVVKAKYKFNDEFICDELVKCTRDAIHSGYVEVQTDKYTFKQPYPKFIIKQDKEGLYYSELFINPNVCIFETKKFKSLDSLRTFIEDVKTYGTTVCTLIVKKPVNGEELKVYSETRYGKPVVSTKETAKSKKEKKADGQLSIFDLIENKEDELRTTVAPVIKLPEDTPRKVRKVTKTDAYDPTKESLSKSFEAKLYLNTEENKKFYSDVKNIILSYEGVYSKISFKHETFKFNGSKIMKMQIRGSKVAILCPFTEEEYKDSKFKFVEVDQFDAHEETPLLYKVYNQLRLRYATEIIKEVMDKYNIPKKSHPEVYDYAAKYHGKDLETLLAEGEIRRQ